MTVNPYKLELPALISFSGGRTSGFMLRKILDAHGGQPENLVICFQNTGLEHAATYDFIKECGERWGVEIHWVEFRHHPERRDPSKPYRGRGSGMGEEFDFELVNYDTAARKGEPFTALIKRLPSLPNPVQRTCTSYLKIRTSEKFVKTLPAFLDDDGGYNYTKAVGLRFDEPRRVHRATANRAGEELVFPMYEAEHTEEDVLEFWKEQPFDLELPLRGNMAGNCVGCFLKGRGKLEILIEEMPEYFEWWMGAEALMAKQAEEEDPIAERPGDGRLFRQDRPSYTSWVKMIENQGSLFPVDDEDTIPCMCTD